MEEATKILKKLTGNKFIEKVVTCMEACGHRWMTEKDHFAVPTRKEVRDLIKRLIIEILNCPSKHRRRYERRGGITVTCEPNSGGYIWSIDYEGPRRAVYTKE